jgi:hypothetical protein
MVVLVNPKYTELIVNTPILIRRAHINLYLI